MRSRVLTLASMVSVAITTAKRLFISGYEDSGLFDQRSLFFLPETQRLMIG
jgi:hypothetical protein